MCKCDRELLELAARAAGMKIHAKNQAERDEMGFGDKGLWIVGGSSGWNPLNDDGDALRLAVKLSMSLEKVVSSRGSAWIADHRAEEVVGTDSSAAARRAIVRAAAAIGEALP